MKLRVVYLIAFLCVPAVLFAQYKTYNLAGYINPDYKYSALDLTFGGDGSLSPQKRTSEYYRDNYDGSEYADKTSEDYSAAALNASGGLAFRTYQSSRKRQTSQQFSMDLSNAYASSERESQTNTLNGLGSSNSSYSGHSNSFSTSASYDYMVRFYNSRKGFFEVSPGAKLSYQHGFNLSKEDDTTELKTTSYHRGAGVNIRLAGGKGRIEEVSDARTAVYILEDLHRKGVVSKILSDDEVNNFASELTRLANARGYDSRLKLIQEITTIDSFLVANAYAEKTNGAAYFTSIYDKWLYARTVTRQSGYRFTFGVVSTYGYAKDGSSVKDVILTNEATETNRFSNTYFANFQYEKPLNLYWQESLFVSLNYSPSLFYSWGNNSRYNISSTTRDMNIGGHFFASYSLTYYPNSRTSISSRIYQSLLYDDKNDNQTFSQGNESHGSSKWLYSSTSLSFQVQYYFSPQLTVDAWCGLSYWYSNNQKSSYLWYESEYPYSRGYRSEDKGYNKYPVPSFNVALVYKIF